MELLVITTDIIIFTSIFIVGIFVFILLMRRSRKKKQGTPVVFHDDGSDSIFRRLDDL